MAVGSVATGAGPRSVVVQGRYAYVANNSANTLGIYDVSNPAAPVAVGSVATGSNPISVVVQGRYAYVANFSGSTLGIYDVSNPAAPVAVGSVATGSGPNSVVVQGRYAYVGNSSANTLGIYDVSNPTTPVAVGSVATGTNPNSVVVQGRYAYIANATSNTLGIYDVSNPAAPASVGSVATGTGPQSVVVQGRYAYTANNSGNTLGVYDVGGTYVQSLEAGSIETGSLSANGSATINGNTSLGSGLAVSGATQLNGGLGVQGQINLMGPLNTTTTSGVIIGTNDTSQTNLVLDNSSTYAETATTCTSTVNNGAVYYNSSSNSIRSCIKDASNAVGAWEDVVTTAGLGIIAFGVVPDSGTAAGQGDLASVIAGGISGPCKVAIGATLQTVSWAKCIAYSNGRKNTIAAGTAATTNATAGNFQHLCLSTVTGQPVLTTSGTETTFTGVIFSVNNPALCLADIKYAAANNTISAVYDTRVYTTSTKTFANVVTTAPTVGMLVRSNGTVGQFVPTSTAADRVYGVVVATVGGTTANTVNTIIVTAGPISIKTVTAPTVNVADAFIIPSTTPGYANMSTTVGANYGTAGLSLNLITTACTINADTCRGAVFTTLNIR